MTNLGVIDCDIHHNIPDIKAIFPYLPRRYKEQIETWGPLHGGFGHNGGRHGRRFDAFPDGEQAGSNLDFMIKQHFEEYNVKYGILTGEFSSAAMVGDPYYAAALCSAYNDYTIEHWLEKDQRLRGSIVIPYHDIAASVKEIERVGSHPQMVQAYVLGGAAHPYGQRNYHPIYEACLKHGLHFAIHVGAEGASRNATTTGAGYPSYYIEGRAARPQVFMAHMASFVFEGVFELYPELKVIFIEAGVFWIAPYFWRLDQDWKALRPQTPWVEKKPSEYLQTNMYYGSQPLEEVPNKALFDQMLEASFAKDRMLFCSDYPHWDFDSPKLTFPKMEKSLLDNVLYNNAAKLYGLPLQNGTEE
ncbi:amidohydrolase [Paenibacillus antri]|uniref:Amidohydrolase n=1 Tax=Paenibacillus antri TaxID=2582848 RepID=A0A5R9GCF6_9BACL|nr:amidohydrolase family protein [Paenibacillus antri]TLS52769.1 amidohydrolase [Paenibacillus antri]